MRHCLGNGSCIVERDRFLPRLRILNRSLNAHVQAIWPLGAGDGIRTPVDFCWHHLPRIRIPHPHPHRRREARGAVCGGDERKARPGGIAHGSASTLSTRNGHGGSTDFGHIADRGVAFCARRTACHEQAPSNLEPPFDRLRAGPSTRDLRSLAQDAIRLAPRVARGRVEWRKTLTFRGRVG